MDLPSRPGKRASNPENYPRPWQTRLYADHQETRNASDDNADLIWIPGAPQRACIITNRAAYRRGKSVRDAGTGFLPDAVHAAAVHGSQLSTINLF